MGNKILGRRSRNFYKGFNQRQLTYLRDKFQSLSEAGVLKRELFVNAYMLDDNLFDAFSALSDFDDQNGVDEYEFICMVSYLCNLSTEQLGRTFFNILSKKGEKIKDNQLQPFTRTCLRYNAYLEGKQVKDSEIKKANKQKFKKYDYDKSKTIQCAQFCSICLKDADYKNWLFNMGFITKNQMDHQEQIYDLVDSDIGEEVERQLRDGNPNVDRIKRGVQNRQIDDQFKPQIEIGQQSSKPVDKPWLAGVQKLKADAFTDQSVPQLSEEAPSQLLTLDYVLGYRSFDCRNNLRFDSKDQIVYHQAALGIVLTNSKQGGRQYDQIYLNEHKDDITCLDSAGDRVVTGQAGTLPMIVVWNTKKIDNGALKSEYIITKNLKESVGNVCFSPSQKYIAATCNDQDHSLVVYDLQQLKRNESELTSTKTGIVCSGPLVKCLIFDIKFQEDQKSLVVATIKEILFVSIEKGVINSSRGDFAAFSPTMALALLPITLTAPKGVKKQQMVAGMGNGSIYFWEKGKCVKALVGHTGSVSVLTKRTDCNSFISGDKTGKIIFWNDSFAKQRQINVPKTNSPSNMIVSLCQGSKKQLLIGTKGSNILLLNNGDGIQKAKSITTGHSDGMIWTAAASQKYLFTGGDDQRLIKWDFTESKKALIDVKCSYKIRSLDFSAKKEMLVVGFVNGIINFYNPANLQKNERYAFTKIKNPDQEALSIVRFEYYGRMVVASYNVPKPKILLFSCDKELKLLGEQQLKFKLISFDLTISDKQPLYLRCNLSSPNGQVYQIYQITTEKEKARFRLMNEKIIKSDWQTHTCPFTPQTRAIISEGVEEKDITCVARGNRFRNVIVAGDRFSKIKLFNYPCPFNKIYNKYEGHSNSITALLFSPKEDYLISIGGQEKAIFIWKYDPVLVKNSYVVDSLDEEEDNEFAAAKVKGDQSLSTPQYKGQIFAPRQFVPNPRRDNKVPQENVKVKHAFGIRSTYIKDEVRNQGKLTLDCKSILFPTACMAIKMDIQSKQQIIFLQHKEDIVSFAVDRERKLMATGQMAEKNLKNPLKKILSIYVWDVQSKKSLVRLDGFHTIAVVLLEFSPSGKLLFSCGNDEKNSFAVYDWRAKTILYSGPVSRAKVNGISWKSQTQFATCGNDHVKFWQNGKGRLCEFAPAKTEAQFCITNSGSVYISGGGMGNIFVWNGNKNPAVLKVHTGKVQCLVDRKNYVYSGGDDGRIYRWKKKGNGSIQNSDLFVDSRSAFPDKKLFRELEYGILSLDFGPENDETYLFITRGCSAIVSQKGSFKRITQGHYDGQLWGLATNNKSDVFITGGDDGSLRLWSISKREEVMRTDCDKWIRAVDWSSSGDKIVFADSYCKITLLDSSLKELSNYSGVPATNNKKGSGWIQEIKFSPNSEVVAYGTHGKSQIMEFLKVEGKKISLLNSFNSGITSALLHIDWSRDSEAISINTQAAQLLFYTLNTKGKCTSASAFRDQKWATWTQKFGFPVQGIFQGPDYSDINTVCRDPLGTFLAVGYDDQTIKLFKYPCYIPKQAHKTFYGHSSHVTRVRFTPNYMVSTGGLDRTIMVWQIERGEQIQKQRQQESGDELSDLDEQVDLPRKIMMSRKKKKKVEQQFRQIEAQGDEFMAVKPWLGAIKEPTYPYPKQTPESPSADILLEYVHGYRTKDCRQNLYFNDDKTLIYHAAAVLIYHDTKANSQKLFTDHRDDILSIDYHRNSGGVVTGELGPKPLVNYYKDAKLLHTFKAPVTKGVLALAISPNGTKAVAAGMDDDHYVAVLDLTKGTVIAKQKGGKKVILKLGWLSEEEFVSVGIRHFKYWTIEGSKLSGKDGNQPANFVSLAITNDKTALTGASAGTIYAWKGKSGKLVTTLKKPPSAQKNAENQQISNKVSVVQSLSVQKGFIAAGTKDGFIFILSQKYETNNIFKLQEILASKGLKSEHPAVRSLDFRGNKMLVGTFGSEIFELQADNISAKESKISRATCHMKGHYSPNNSWTNEVWGLYVDGDLVFTCSDDATVRCWSIEKRTLQSIASLNLIEHPKNNNWYQSPKDDKTNDFYDSSKGRSVCVSPDRRFVIVGCKEGTVRIFRFDEKSKKMEMFQKFRHAQQWISQIKFGFNLLLIGSHDNGIYVYDYDADQELFKRKYRPMKKHSSYITHFDVSRDSCYLQSTCGAYQLLFWDLNTGKQITSGASMLRDQRWATWTCNLGWPVQGIYPKCTDGTFIHSVDRSNSSIKASNYKDDPKSPYLLAGGNNNGQICLYNYPCTIKNSQYVAGVGHSSHVTNVRWTSNDQRVISVGGEDQCVMYWRVKKNR